MWHASVTLQNRKGKIDDRLTVEAGAVAALAGVGSPEGEWWLWSPRLVGHLRIPVTAAEFAVVPPGCVLDDAGEAGEWRGRTL